MRNRALVLLAASLGTALFAFFGPIGFPGGQVLAQSSTQRKVQRPQPTRPAARKPRIDYSKFSHETHVQKEKLACDSCHKFPSKNWKEVRKGDEAFPDVTDFPEHQACLGCHRVQFFARERPAPVICANCHVAVTPRNTARQMFPSLGEPFLASNNGRAFVSEFKVAFPHDKHIDVVGANLPSQPEKNSGLRYVFASFSYSSGRRNQEEPKSCPVCHETYQPQGASNEEFVTPPPKNLADEAFWLKKGAFKTTPVSHSACSTCHNEEAGIPPAPSDCGACHKPAVKSVVARDFDPKTAASMGITDWRMLRQWSRRSSGRFRHEYEVHAALSCSDCHNPTVMNILDEKTLLSVKSCGGGGSGCHVEATTDGILNYEVDQRKTNPSFQCTKCHINLGKNPVPENHLEVIKAAAPK